nr:hypothetical protein [Tanacetum cinerariifolium]
MSLAYTTLQRLVGELPLWFPVGVLHRIQLILCKAITMVMTTWSAKGLHLQLCEVRGCDPMVLEDHVRSSHEGDKNY